MTAALVGLAITGLGIGLLAVGVGLCAVGTYDRLPGWMLAGLMAWLLGTVVAGEGVKMAGVGL